MRGTKLNFLQRGGRARSLSTEARSDRLDTGDVKEPRSVALWIGRTIVFILPILVIVAAIVGFIVMGLLKPPPEKKEEVIKAVPVLTATARSESLRLTALSQGEVLPRSELDLVPQISGKISYMAPGFIEGGRFKRGDILVRIDAAEYQLRVTQARARVAQSETSLAREQSEGAIAAEDWKDIGSGTATSLTLRQPQLAEANADLAAANAALEEAELLLSRATLYAPFTGRVTSRSVDRGEFVTAGAALGSIYGTDIMDVRLPLTNQDMAQTGLTLGYEAGDGTPDFPVTLMANIAGVDREWKGEIVRTDSRYDSQTRVLYAYVEVQDPFGTGASDGVPLAPGLFVSATIFGQNMTDAVIVPRAALRGNDQVYLANPDDTLTVQTVTVRASDRDRAVLSQGVTPGARVITSPVRGVATGMKIAVVDRLPDPASESARANPIGSNPDGAQSEPSAEGDGE